MVTVPAAAPNNKMHRGKGNILTRSKLFKALVDHAFGVVDSDKTGEVGKTELYAGLLLVHLKLAKHAGPAACYPPTRQTCDLLFEAADSDRSGTIDKIEFANILGILCGQILSRMFVYYAILIFLVPRLAVRVVDVAEIPNGSYLEMAAEQVISMSLFFVVIPVIWNIIDNQTQALIADTAALAAATATASSVGATASAAAAVPSASTTATVDPSSNDELTEKDKKAD